MSELSCPACGTELSPGVLFASADAQAAFARLAAVSIPLGARVMQYLTLFTPPKTRLTVAKQCKLLLGLLPDLERQAITAKGREWPVPLELWARAFDQLQASRQANRLDLPLSGHGYLHAVLVALSDKQEAAQEAAVEAERRHRPVAPEAPVDPIARAADPVPIVKPVHNYVPMPEDLKKRWIKPKPKTDPDQGETT